MVVLGVMNVELNSADGGNILTMYLSDIDEAVQTVVMSV